MFCCICFGSIFRIYTLFIETSKTHLCFCLSYNGWVRVVYSIIAEKDSKYCRNRETIYIYIFIHMYVVIYSLFVTISAEIFSFGVFGFDFVG